ncbi:RNA ligase-domain-containing protein [Mucor mucedo]|uniref:RNA ligase-domain-containing protein n=1 Tax=Mucor mucedo TaxID=29922 RepID=UPI00221F839A|nr:RNA ligase-domain-containing protein [Mucor mucedo]KAI7870509.1 RNA ligase-domain-containing protein [Mucor mucedo]
MANINIPTIDLNQDQIQNVVEKLYEIKKSTSKDLRSKDFTLENGQVWTSWTMRESAYKKKAESLPTMARGIFTQNIDGDYFIKVRGYDKFFNVLETTATQWPYLEKDTVGPYEVTAKENGCIIFIAALSKESVIVTSKHSIPAIKTDSQAHAGVGYNWVLKHLDSVGKTERDLAEWLFDKNVTLVAELCDDEFEQHILPYTGKERGLYLHGINYNTDILHTLPSDLVQKTAIEFGFHVTDYKVFETMKEVKQYGDEMQQTGLYDGREVEGAVVRCKRNGNDFMFKIKNEQYLVYREYREVTKALIEVSDEGLVTINSKKARCTYEKTPYYIEWLHKRVIDKPEWFREFKFQKGIIHARQEFEKFWEAGKLSEL